MRRRLPLYVLLASALAFLASLYLTWLAGSGPTTTKTTHGLLDLFSGISYNGWGPFGQAAALLGLASIAGAGAIILRPQLATRLPLVSCAFALLFFAVDNAAELRGRGLFQGAFEQIPVHVGAGAYLGIAMATVACLAAAVARWDELARRPSATAVVAGVLTLGLLAAFLLPWLHVHVPHPEAGATGYQISELGDNAVIFIVAIACFGLPLWMQGQPPGPRLVTALGIAVLTAGSLSELGTHAHWSFERWLWLGCSLGLVALSLTTSRGPRLSLPSAPDTAAVVAASMLVASLFLPWQKDCAHGPCFSATGWSLDAYSSAAGGLAVILIVFLLGFRRLVVELALGVAIYVMAAGSQITVFTGLGYGAPLGFAGAALLLLVAARRLRSVPREPRRIVRLVPMAACVGFLAIPVVTLTGRLSPTLEIDSPWRIFWLELTAILVAVRLLGRWLTGPRDDVELLLLPFVLLVLTMLDLIEGRGQGVSWEGWASVVLCAVLVAFGWIERNGGLEKLGVPEEIWRIDRLPGEN